MTSGRKKEQKVIDSRHRIFYGGGVPQTFPKYPRRSECSEKFFFVAVGPLVGDVCPERY